MAGRGRALATAPINAIKRSLRRFFRSNAFEIRIFGGQAETTDRHARLVKPAGG